MGGPLSTLWLIVNSFVDLWRPRLKFTESLPLAGRRLSSVAALRDGVFSTPYQYTLEQLKAAVNEAARVGKNVAVHAMGEPGALYAAEAGVVSIDKPNAPTLSRTDLITLQ